MILDRGRREALVFIHGYNTPFDEALRRTAQLSFDLRFTGATILYSWPSEGETFKYTVDEANIEWTAPHFEAFLRMVLNRISAERVHIVAHSMGNRALARALVGLDRDPPPESAAKLHQVVFAAPDVDADVFRRSALQFHDQADRITLYASSNDQALKASKSVHGYPRAGESGADIVVVEGIDTIDASLVETDFLGHSYFGDRESVISDLLNLIRESRPPSERPWLSPRQHAAARYWLFQP